MCCSPHTFRGGNTDLEARAKDLKLPALNEVIAGLGWSANAREGQPFDLDASAIGLGRDGKCLSEDWFVFFNNLTSPGEVVKHTGDNLTGDGDGDDEQIVSLLQGAPSELDRIVFTASIYDAEARQQDFSMVRDAYIRLIAPNPAASIPGVDPFVTFTRYDLSGLDFFGMTSMVFGELYRKSGLFGPTWKFRAIGQGYDSGLAGIIKDYGIEASSS